MTEYTIRRYQSPADARAQYNLWLAATEGLTRPWRSCLRNVEHQLARAEEFPGCRLYAETHDGRMVGYIGAHPPFEWDPDAHGPPSERLGWAIPLGLPWTHPRDAALEAELYDRMIASLPETFEAFQRDIYIQRFRESWGERLEFLTSRGWRLLKRLPLLGRSTDGADAGPALGTITEDDLSWLAGLSERDPVATAATTGQLAAWLAGGWITPDAFYRVGEHGAFALEPRGRWAAVTVFYAAPEQWDETLAAAAAQAAAMGAGEVYFTIDEGDDALAHALGARGFGEVDAGVYYVRDAD